MNDDALVIPWWMVWSLGVVGGLVSAIVAAIQGDWGLAVAWLTGAGGWTTATTYALGMWRA